MLSIDNIVKQYPLHIREGHEVDILKEYLQYFILDAIYQSSIGKEMCFIGGTALRLLHKNQRFSEDLDFDNTNIAFDDFSHIQEIIQKKFLLYGVKTECVPTERDAYHLWIKIPNILYEQNLATNPRQKIKIRIDTHHQGLDYKYQQILLKKFDVGRVIQVAPLDVLMAMKIIAIPQRTVAKGRDYFDLIFLMNKGIKPNSVVLKQVLGPCTNDRIKKLLIDRFQQSESEALLKDVQKFLFNPEDDAVLFFDKYVESYDFVSI